MCDAFHREQFEVRINFSYDCVRGTFYVRGILKGAVKEKGSSDL